MKNNQNNYIEKSFKIKDRQIKFKEIKSKIINI